MHVDWAVTGASSFLAVLVLPVVLIHQGAGVAPWTVACAAAVSATVRLRAVYRRVRTG